MAARKSPDRWKRVGLTARQVRDAVESCDEFFPQFRKYGDAPQDWQRQTDLHTCFTVLQLTHLGTQPTRLSAAECLPVFRQLSLDYFWGDWRTANRWQFVSKASTFKSARAGLGWIDELNWALMATLLGGDVAEVKRIAGYPDTDLKFDAGFRERSPDDNRFFIILCRFITDGNLKQSTRLITSIRKSKRSRPKLLLAALECLAQGQADTFQAKLTDILVKYRRQELDRKTSVIICYDATILFLLAAQLGVEVSLDADNADFIMTRQSLGLS